MATPESTPRRSKQMKLLLKNLGKGSSEEPVRVTLSEQDVLEINSFIAAHLREFNRQVSRQAKRNNPTPGKVTLNSHLFIS